MGDLERERSRMGIVLKDILESTEGKNRVLGIVGSTFGICSCIDGGGVSYDVRWCSYGAILELPQFPRPPLW